MLLDERLLKAVPAPRQHALQEVKFYSLVHFTVNTFTAQKLNDGTENKAVFNPIRFDAD